MKKVTNIIFGIIIVILLSIGIFFLYQKFSSSTETLAHYLPENTQYYLEIDLSDDNFRENLEKNQALKKYFFGFLIKQGISENILELDKNSIIGLAGVKLFEQEEKLWLVANKNIYQLQALLPQDYYFTVLDKQVAALSSSHEFLQVIRNKLKEPAETRQSPALGYLNLPVHGFMSKENLFKNKWLIKKQKIPLSACLNSLDLKNKINFGFNIIDDQLFFDIDAGQLASNNQNAEQLFNFIPNLDHIASVNNINLADFLDALLAQTQDSGIDPKLLAAKYNFSWYELRQILDQPALLIISYKKESLKGSDLLDLANFGYTIVLDKVDKPQQATLEQVFKNVLAFKHPATTTQTLPDESLIDEIIADPNNIQFSTQEVEVADQGKILIYSYHSPQVNLAFAKINQHFIMSNSDRFIKAVLKSYQVHKLTTTKNTLDQCKLNHRHQTILFNPNLIGSKFFSLFSQGLFNLDNQGVTGCWKIR